MELKDFDLYEIYLKWIQGADVFRCFFRSTNFVTLKHFPNIPIDMEPVREEDYKRLIDLANGCDMQNTLLFIDLPGAKSIEAAFILQNNLAIKPILTYNNVMHPNQLIGTEQYISKLLFLGSNLSNIIPRGYAFILDQNRYGTYADEDYRKYFNNQYELTDVDLPSCEMLKELQYQNIVYLYSTSVKEDIQNYLDFLNQNALTVILKEC